MPLSCRTERTKEYLELEVNKSFMELQLAYKAVGVLEKQVLCRGEFGINRKPNKVFFKKQIYYPFKFALMK
jgi:hypothetical protein